MFGIDGKLVYSSSGDVIDVATHKIVGTTRSEWGTLHPSLPRLPKAPNAEEFEEILKLAAQRGR